MVKNLPVNAGDLGSVPGLGRAPGGGNGNYSSILAWRIPWTEEPVGPQSMGSPRVRHAEPLALSLSKVNMYILKFFDFKFHFSSDFKGMRTFLWKPHPYPLSSTVNPKRCA